MAVLTAGSPAIQATPNSATPAASPAAMPRISSVLVTAASVAGEAEQVPAVVHELVHVRAGHDRQGALVHADEVDEGQQGEPEERPRPQLAQRDGRGERGSAGSGKGNLARGDVLHDVSSFGMTRPVQTACTSPSILAPGSAPLAGLPNPPWSVAHKWRAALPVTVARPRRILTGFLGSRRSSYSSIGAARRRVNERRPPGRPVVYGPGVASNGPPGQPSAPLTALWNASTLAR